ncbi:phage tail tube protein [Acinetobacter ursingii]|uniref:phage tail tube protein n=1 Tax=Acinetobacter ursingii TaxID=108980 RepID=UPI0021D2FCFB|nr:hypothetical protein [Acinetobacter ursingii]MCU4571083.1 hypothetical protein [Acinetobacter ursingii]
MAEMKDFSFQGPIYLGDNVNGVAQKLRWVGDQSSLNFAIDAQFEERKENYTGLRTTSVRLKQSVAVNPEMVLRYVTPENILLGVHGKLSKKAAGTATAEEFPLALVAGDLVLLKNGNVTNLVLTDSKTPTATPLVEGTHYSIESNVSGMVKILDVSTLTQPIKAAYSYGGSTNVSMMTAATPPVKYLYMEAINTVDGRRARVHLYKVQFNPLASLPLTNENLADFTLNGTCLADANNRLDDDLGPFGRIEWLDEVT